MLGTGSDGDWMEIRGGWASSVREGRHGRCAVHFSCSGQVGARWHLHGASFGLRVPRGQVGGQLFPRVWDRRLQNERRQGLGRRVGRAAVGRRTDGGAAFVLPRLTVRTLGPDRSHRTGALRPDRDVISFGREILPLSIYGVGTIHSGVERRGIQTSQRAKRSRWRPKTRKLASKTVERKICRAT